MKYPPRIGERYNHPPAEEQWGQSHHSFVRWTVASEGWTQM